MPAKEDQAIPVTPYYDDARVLGTMLDVLGINHHALADICSCRQHTAHRWVRGFGSPARKYRALIIEALEARGCSIIPELREWGATIPRKETPSGIVPDDTKTAAGLQKELEGG